MCRPGARKLLVMCCYPPRAPCGDLATAQHQQRKMDAWMRQKTCETISADAEHMQKLCCTLPSRAAAAATRVSSPMHATTQPHTHTGKPHNGCALCVRVSCALPHPKVPGAGGRNTASQQAPQQRSRLMQKAREESQHCVYELPCSATTCCC